MDKSREMLGHSAFVKYQRQLARENLQVVLDNGFDPPTWENFPIKVMLVVTEVSEGIDAVLGGGDDPLPEELADIWIRISGILAAIWEDSWDVRYNTMHKHHVYEPIEVLMWPIVRRCCDAVEAWRRDEVNDTRMELEFALKETAILAFSLGIPLNAEIEKKMHKNSKRDKFHGKAKSSG